MGDGSTEAWALRRTHCFSGCVRGFLAAGEDRSTFEQILVQARDLVLNGQLDMLLHAEPGVGASASLPDLTLAARRESLRAGKLKRYVLRVQTSAGARIVKIAEVQHLGNVLLGILGTSVAQREHFYQRRAESLGLAAAQTLGFLEWRTGLRLVRACQIQTPVPPHRISLTHFLEDELGEYGHAALDSLAAAIAATHRVPFFHADLKGFHAYVDAVVRHTGGPATYRLQWIDLGRVGFRVSSRRRLINLYQALRFLLPSDPEAQERFVRQYCRLSGWHAAHPEWAIAQVRRFLAHKIRTHPAP